MASSWLAQLFIKLRVETWYYVFAIFMVLVARLCSMERLLLELPNTLQKILADQLGAFQRYPSCLHLFASTHVHVRIEVPAQKLCSSLPWPAQKFLCSSATAPMNPDVLDKRRGWPPFFLLVACHFSRMPFTAAWYEEHGDGEPLQLVVEHGGAPQG
uniref:Uncharacterized protein n=2 Tax=Aegilops tauschii TaxID=37682 RepID=A0A453KVK2_AEGTS